MTVKGNNNQQLLTPSNQNHNNNNNNNNNNHHHQGLQPSPQVKEIGNFMGADIFQFSRRLQATKMLRSTKLAESGGGSAVLSINNGGSQRQLGQ